jgi:hypothetical protein
VLDSGLSAQSKRLARTKTHSGLVAEDALKTLFLSLLAFQPAANAVETIVFNARWVPHRRSTKPIGARKSDRIFSDCAWGPTSYEIGGRTDEPGHHRYYGRDAYP